MYMHSMLPSNPREIHQVLLRSLREFNDLLGDENAYEVGS
jgi:hypothetical protein